MNLKGIFLSIAKKYCKDDLLTQTLWQEIMVRYSEEWRIYHNLEHIGSLMEQATAFHFAFMEPESVMMAIFYHDIIYAPDGKNNESQSAALAGFRLGEMDFPAYIIDHCAQHILATRDHLPSMNHDTNYMIDFDLAILGQQPEQYAWYTVKLRQEYQVIPDELFYEERKNILMGFLQRDRIYATDEYYQRYETQARANMERELDQLP